MGQVGRQKVEAPQAAQAQAPQATRYEPGSSRDKLAPKSADHGAKPATSTGHSQRRKARPQKIPIQLFISIKSGIK